MYRLLFFVLILFLVQPVLSSGSEDSIDSAYMSMGWDAFKKGDVSAAIKIWLPLAEKGNQSAQYKLAQIYSAGEGVPQDYQLAIKWYTLAAEQGHAESQANLGILYLEGNGAAQDNLKAYMFFYLAAGNGSKRASSVLANMDIIMTLSQIEEAQALSRAWVVEHTKW